MFPIDEVNLIFFIATILIHSSSLDHHDQVHPNHPFLNFFFLLKIFGKNLTPTVGGRTAWSTIVAVNGVPYSARFWYDGKYVEQAKQDAAEVAFTAITGRQTSQSPVTAKQYVAHSHMGHAATV